MYKSAGVTKIPRRLPSTALHKAVATLPPALDDKITHIFTVVGNLFLYVSRIEIMSIISIAFSTMVYFERKKEKLT